MASDQATNQPTFFFTQSKSTCVEVDSLELNFHRKVSPLFLFHGLGFRLDIGCGLCKLRLCVFSGFSKHPTVTSAWVSLAYSNGNLQYQFKLVKKTEMIQVFKSEMPSQLPDKFRVCICFLDSIVLTNGSPGVDLWNSALQQQFTDVTFKVGDREFAAHKAVICARSPVFARMFSTTDMEEAKTGIVRIEDFTPEVFEEFLRFIYTGLVKDDDTLNKMYEQLGVAADKYDVPSLKQLCSWDPLCTFSMLEQLTNATTLTFE